MKKVKGSKALIELLKHHGTECVFGIPGATEIFFMEELERTPEIKFILALNEMVCVGAAEGYGRAKGKPAVLNLHTGPGMAAAMPLLLNAKYGKVPMVILVGQNDTRLLVKDPQLSGDIVSMAKPVVKWATEIHRGQDIPVAVNRAFKMAMQPPMGPVAVSIPSDLMNEEVQLDLRSLPPYGYNAGRGDSHQIAHAKSLILQAENPVLLVQEGVARNRALAETVKFAELLGAPVYQIWMGDVNFPVRHPQYRGDIDSTSPQMVRVLRESDLLIEIGGQLFNDAFYSDAEVLPEALPVVQIDDDPWELGKSFPVDCPIQGDIREVLAELNGLLEKEYDLAEKAAKRRKLLAAESERQQEALSNKIEAEKNRQPVAVTALMAGVSAAMTDKTYIVDDCWSSSAMLRAIVDFKDEKSLYRPRNGGSIGFGLPGGLGVKLACPEKEVLVLSGDGSAAWSMQTFWTAAHYRIPVIMIITNNGTYRQVKNVRKRILGDYPLNEPHLGMEIDNPVISFMALAKSMGVSGCQVHKAVELSKAIENGRNCKEPYLIEVFVENRPD